MVLMTEDKHYDGMVTMTKGTRRKNDESGSNFFCQKIVSVLIVDRLSLWHNNFGVVNNDISTSVDTCHLGLAGSGIGFLRGR